MKDPLLYASADFIDRVCGATGHNLIQVQEQNVQSIFAPRFICTKCSDVVTLESLLEIQSQRAGERGTG
jgi:hypothetical protein